MLIDLHKPDLSKAQVRLGDLNTLTPFPRKLEYSCPSRGGWTIAHTPMIIPGSHMIYIGASACLRGVVLSAAEYEGLDRYSMVMIEEKDILSGQMEELFIEGVTDILNKLEHRPTCVLPFTGCIHYFLATDIEYIYDELSARFPDIDFISAQMTPTMKLNDHTPEEDMCRSMYLCIEEQPLNGKVVNFIGDNFPIATTGDHMKLLHKHGFRTHDLAAMDDYAEYKAMGESFLNIYSLPVAAWSAACLEERLGQQFIYMPYTYIYDEIDRDMTRLAAVLDVEAPDLTDMRTEAEESLANALSIVGNTQIGIDYMSTPRFLSLARMLLSHGFNVTEIYGDSLTPDSIPDLEWLKQHYPDIPLKATQDFRARFYPRDEEADGKVIAIGQKAAYFMGTGHFVNMITNNGRYGYDAIKSLAAELIDAYENEKDTKSIIQVKAWGCSA